jgi:hypothetical protein
MNKQTHVTDGWTAASRVPENGVVETTRIYNLSLPIETSIFAKKETQNTSNAVDTAKLAMEHGLSYLLLMFPDAPASDGQVVVRETGLSPVT